MSMIYSLVQLRADKIAMLMERPELIRPLLGLSSKSPKRAQSPADDVIANDFDNDSLPKTDLEKAWHGLHFLLTGSDWEGDLPYAYLLLGGAQIGKIDVGYGPARALRPQEVREFDVCLASVTTDFLTSHFDPNKMTELGIYPFAIASPAPDDDLRYLLLYFEDLKSFVSDAAAHGHGVVTYLS
ncbi:MAG: YfbM family protein [Capsulimonas sp.]|uniref:YfbM family protein n=1 Tax=Capsulimonas sp. TaxID=2494211 RepID=UPI003263DEC3